MDGDSSKQIKIIFLTKDHTESSFEKLAELIEKKGYKIKVSNSIASVLGDINNKTLLIVDSTLNAFYARFLRLLIGTPYIVQTNKKEQLDLIEILRAVDSISSVYSPYVKNIIPVGINLRKYSTNINVADLVRKYTSSPKEKILLCEALDHEDTEIITLINTFDILVNQKGRNNLKLMVITKEPDNRYLINKIKGYRLDNNIFFVSNNSIDSNKYYCFADAYISANLNDNIGDKFYKAMASGTPIIAPETKANTFYLKNHGVLTESNEPEILAGTIIETLSNEFLLNELKQRGLKKVTDLSWENQIQKFEKIYLDTSMQKCVSIKCKLIVLGYILIDLPFYLIKITKEFFNMKSLQEIIFKPYNHIVSNYLNKPFMTTILTGPIKDAKIYISPKHGLKKIIGNYEPKITDAISEVVNPEDTCFDIGSHIGYMSLYLHKLVGPNGKVLAIDPIEEGCNMLTKSIEANNIENIRVYNIALGNENTSKEAHVFVDSAMANFLDSGFVTYEETDAKTFEMITLDKLVEKESIRKVDFLKIDVEGYEHNVLLGAQKTIKEHKPRMLIEIHNKVVFIKVLNFLVEKGYKITDLEKNTLDENYNVPEQPFHIIAI